MFRKLFVAASAFALLAITACSSDGGGSAAGEDELRGKACGGIGAIQCPSGQTCKLAGDYPDAMGKCVAIAPGKEGGICGGIAGFRCDSGLYCDFSAGNGGGAMPPGAVGLPAPARDAGSGMPPGAVGLPAPARDAGSGMPPGAVGLPAPARDAGSGMPPGTVGLPDPYGYPDQSGICVRNTQSFCARVRCASGTTCDEEQRACVPNNPSFCAAVDCSPGYTCSEEQRTCVPNTGNFCARARCASGTECNEAQRACVPYACPPSGDVDCEPGGPLPKACTGAYHTWVVAHCPNVTFLY